MHEGWSFDRGIISPEPLRGPEGFRAGFTTIDAGDFSAPEPQSELCARLFAKRLRLLRQVHGVVLLAPSAPGDKPEADGWAGALSPGEILAVKAADCLPVLLWSETAPIGAAVHAGWRGAVAGIGGCAVRQLGADPTTLRAALGPCICPSCYEVGEEVALAAGGNPKWLKDGPPGKYHFDLAAYVAADLEKAGIPPERIAALGLCTKCRRDLFWSWRGDATAKRMIGFLGIGS